MMDIEIQYIKDAGIIDKERLVLKVLKDCNLGNYFTFYSHYVNGKSVSTEVIAPFWFADLDVSHNDIIVIYTKSGPKSSKKNTAGSSSYFFYRNKKEPLCNNNGICAIILEVASWNSSGKKT